MLFVSHHISSLSPEKLFSLIDMLEFCISVLHQLPDLNETLYIFNVNPLKHPTFFLLVIKPVIKKFTSLSLAVHEITSYSFVQAFHIF